VIATRVTSTAPALRWEDALVSGNGSTGIMVLGRPLDERIVVNHEKLWVPPANALPQPPQLAEAWREARRIAREGRYRDADEAVVARVRAWCAEHFDEAELVKGVRLPYERVHPGFHLHVDGTAAGAVERYRRVMHLDSGELSVRWTDTRGEWLRRAFVSRTHDVIVLEIVPPVGAAFDGSLRLAEAPGRQEGDFASVRILHDAEELSLHAVYGRSLGRPEPEGYHALGRVLADGGSVSAVANQRLDVRGARRVLLLLTVEYLDQGRAAARDRLRARLGRLPDDYEELLAPHAAEHGEMFRRVTLDLGGEADPAAGSEVLIDRARSRGPGPELLELLHAVGRYALICGATGELPPALTGIWGDEWSPAWDGRYTFDANLNLAVSAGSQGDLPEVMETFFRFVERHLPDWRRNAEALYGCRGVVADLCQGWRHGVVLMAAYPWTGGAGWLASYFYDHYLYTRDREFLRRRVVPLLKEVAAFYEDFLAATSAPDGPVVFYPSISPENSPRTSPPEQSTNVVPNATCEIAICREVLTSLLAACEELAIEDDGVPRWRRLLERLPAYRINEDGALAEWAMPELGDHYSHRHSSHLYPVYPSLEVSPERTPELFAAARQAMAKRLEAGLGNKSAHGLMHAALLAGRLRSGELAWRMLSMFARASFLNTSLITCHNPGLRIYNLDATFSLPAVLMKMLLHSEPGRLVLLPALPADHLRRGSLRGARARGGIVVEELHWNVLLRRIALRVRSAAEQTVDLSAGLALRSVRAEGTPKEQPEPLGDARWRVRLPAGRAVSLEGSI